MRSFIKNILVGSLFLTAFSCLPDPACTKNVSPSLLSSVNQTQLESDVAAIDKFLTDNAITGVVEDPSGLRYVIHTEGSGKKPCLESNIKVTYELRLLTNKDVIIEESTDPITFPLNALILGWQIGFSKLKKGTTATLYIPSGYAYGASGSGSVPANANLIFNVELIAIK